jgi:hypothetical protein
MRSGRKHGGFYAWRAERTARRGRWPPADDAVRAEISFVLLRIGSWIGSDRLTDLTSWPDNKRAR